MQPLESLLLRSWQSNLQSIELELLSQHTERRFAILEPFLSCLFFNTVVLSSSLRNSCQQYNTDWLVYIRCRCYCRCRSSSGRWSSLGEMLGVAALVVAALLTTDQARVGEVEKQEKKDSQSWVESLILTLVELRAIALYELLDNFKCAARTHEAEMLRPRIAHNQHHLRGRNNWRKQHSFHLSPLVCLVRHKQVYRKLVVAVVVSSWSLLVSLLVST